MIRFILSREIRFDGNISSDLETLDIDCPLLEGILCRGGFGGGPDGGDFDKTHLIGAEVRKGKVPK